MPIGRDIEAMLSELRLERKYADSIHVEWSPNTLHQLLDQELPGAQVIVVSNSRALHPQPRRRPRRLANAGEWPRLGAGTGHARLRRRVGRAWFGVGGRDTADGRDRVPVPPDKPAYALRRVWISDEEQDGYYYGLANEGLWPLCHIAFVRPTFRERDWAHYVEVNQRFADVVIEEADRDDPIVLVQDHHFALLPRMLRRRLPRATIIAFWHIPWPNPETFGICPWREQIIDGLLGASILGFHTPFHCNNFVEAVDRFMESRIDRERSSVTLAGHETLVRSYPISIEWPPAAIERQAPVEECRRAVRSRFWLSPDTHCGWDRALRLHQGHRGPDARGRRSPGVPSRVARQARVHPGGGADRSKLTAYRGLQAEAAGEAEAINARWGNNSYKPVVLSVRHHEPAEVFELFRAADLCIVSSLHDGINLSPRSSSPPATTSRGCLCFRASPALRANCRKR